MSSVQDFGELAAITGEAIGPPGQRRFRLCMLAPDAATAACWMEKEQLAALGEAMEQVLRDQGYAHTPRPLDDATQEPVFPLNADIEFRVGRLSVGLNAEERRIFVTAGDAPEGESDEVGEVHASIDYEQAHTLAAQIKEVVAAGRQPCPLCKGPLEPSGHVCVKTNGHHPH